MTNEKNNDRELDRYLQGNDELSKEYREISLDSPPDHIDKAILAASKKAVEAKPVNVITPFSSHWYIPASIAAVVVISVLLVFNIPDDTLRVQNEIDFDVRKNAVMMDNNFDENTPVEISGQAKELFIDNEETSLLIPQRDEYLSEDNASSFRLLERSAVPASEMIVNEFRTELDTVQPTTVPASPSTLLLIDDIENTESDTSIRLQSADINNNTMSDSAMTEENKAAVEKSVFQSRFTDCLIPRPDFCAEIYQPVCATRDAGIRCITTPCDSSEEVDYANVCNACSSSDVIGYLEGRCE